MWIPNVARFGESQKNRRNWLRVPFLNSAVFTFDPAVAGAEEPERADAVVERHDDDVTVRRQGLPVIHRERVAARVEAASVNPDLQREYTHCHSSQDFPPLPAWIWPISLSHFLKSEWLRRIGNYPTQALLSQSQISP